MKELPSAAAVAVFILSFAGTLQRVLGEEHPPEALRHPGGPRCYYDALADGCPTSISADGHKFLCGCDYRDNKWFHVLGNYLSIFRTGESERGSLATKLKARPENGMLTLDVGLPERLQCSAELAKVYPGTNNLLDIDELYSMLGSILWPQVRAALTDICVPGRLALQLICQHALLHGLKDVNGAKAYALQAWKLYEMVDKCVQDQTPWPFPGVGEFLKGWSEASIPDASAMAWYPDPGLMRGKRPEESESHFWPCVPLKDPECFPSGSDFVHTSCSNCCDPGLGPTGDASCFDGYFTFARCCRTPQDSGRFY